MISGYWLYADSLLRENKKLIKRIKHTAKQLMIFILAAVSYQLLISLFKTHGVSLLLQFLADRLTIENIIRTALLSETLFGRGEWFLWGMLEAYIILLISSKTKMGSSIRRSPFLVSGFLLFVHTVIRWILIFIGVSGFGAIDLYASYCVRNVWFDALPFILVGYGIHKRHNEKKSIKNKKLIVMFAVGMIAAIAEAFVLNYLYRDVECVLYIGIIMADYCLLELSINNPAFGEKSYIEYIGCSLSMISYFIHVEVESIIGNVASFLKIDGTEAYGFLYPFITITGVLAAAQVIFFIKEIYSKHKYRSVN